MCTSTNRITNYNATHKETNRESYTEANRKPKFGTHYQSYYIFSNSAASARSNKPTYFQPITETNREPFETTYFQPQQEANKLS